jgi:hypothetical protein
MKKQKVELKLGKVTYADHSTLPATRLKDIEKSYEIAYQWWVQANLNVKEKIKKEA